MILITNSPIVIYEDKIACVAQVRLRYIKEDKTKHISLKFFYTHELKKNRQINVKQIHSTNNLVDLITKLLPTTFEKFVYVIGMQRVYQLQD